MVSLHPIPEEARQELEDGNAVWIKPNGCPGFVIGFQEDFDKAMPIKDWEWEVEHGWDHLRSDDDPSSSTQQSSSKESQS